VLLIYLHGVVAPTGRAQTVVQQVVARSARAHGFIALVPRGLRGIGPGATKDWWAWPTTSSAYDRHAKEMIASWLASRDALVARTGGAFERTYLAGSSNGAYFVAVLAMKGDIDVDGFGAMSGGSRGSRTKGTIAASHRPPFYVGYGTQDEANADPIALGALLAEAGWEHEVRAHAVGHGARDVYLDEAFDFWSSR
jgi:predicted esterase